MLLRTERMSNHSELIQLKDFSEGYRGGLWLYFSHRVGSFEGLPLELEGLLFCGMRALSKQTSCSDLVSEKATEEALKVSDGSQRGRERKTCVERESVLVRQTKTDGEEG